MPTIPCPNTITCECIDNPFGNFTAEGPDVDRFLAVSYVFNPPPLNQFGVLGCKSWCWSTVSQAEAELCALAQATLCGPPPPFNPPGLFGNVAQTCDYNCPDGSTSSYTVAANQVYESTQAAADALAFSVACIGAESNAHCIPTPQPPDGGSGPTATAWWKMEEAFGNRMDSVHGMALVPVTNGFGSVSQVAGKVGSGVSCIEANDSSAYLTSGGYAALGFNSNGQTLLGWCKVQHPVANGGILTFGYFSISFDLLNNHVNVIFDTVGLSNVSAPMATDEWIFFAIYYDSVTGKIGVNINGVIVAESADTIFPDEQPNGFVGFSPAYNDVAASLDELAFYQTKLNAAQIAAIYNAGGGRTYPVTLPP